jgi:hypothetical protein
MTIKDLSRSAENASRKAVSDAFSKGLPITVQRGKQIIKIYPDGKEELIVNLERAYVKAGKKSFNL